MANKKNWRYNMATVKFAKGFFTVVLAFLFTVVLAVPSWGQPAYPAKSINLYIGYAPGGVADISVRFLASKAEKLLGQPFVITNNGGGGSSVATGIVAKKPADGYTILGGASSGLVRLPHLQNVPYKYEDFAPIMHFATPSLTPVVVKSTSPWKTFKELVDYAKKNPGKVTYSTLGVGSPMHMAMEYVAKQEKITWTHVPFPGAMPAFTALLGDHVNVCIGAGESVPYIKDGTVRILANLSEKRVKAWPSVPTFRELGYDFFNESVFMFSAPKGTPEYIIEKLQDAFHKVMNDPEFAAIMTKVEFEPVYRNSADTKKYLDDANIRLGRMVKEMNLEKKN
jgi:tripartite-type tricarboxylate transporter receptor subunit TctC